MLPVVIICMIVGQLAGLYYFMW